LEMPVEITKEHLEQTLKEADHVEVIDPSG
jgi:hypothetical protein